MQAPAMHLVWRHYKELYDTTLHSWFFELLTKQVSMEKTLELSHGIQRTICNNPLGRKYTF